MTIRSGRANDGLPPRKPCDKCGLPVFIGERLTVGKLLFHRTCFRCARCDNNLTPANYYQTETNKFCCETCPDEIAAAESLTSRSISDEEKSILKETTMYKTALEYPEFEVSEANSDSEFVKARSFFMNTQLEDSPPTLPKSKPPETVKNTNSEVLAIGLTVSVNSNVRSKNISTKEVKTGSSTDSSCIVIEDSTGDSSCVFIDDPPAPIPNDKPQQITQQQNFDDDDDDNKLKTTQKHKPPDQRGVDNKNISTNSEIVAADVEPEERKEKIPNQEKNSDYSRPPSAVPEEELLDFQKIISNLKPVKRKSLEKNKPPPLIQGEEKMIVDDVSGVHPKIEITPADSTRLHEQSRLKTRKIEDISVHSKFRKTEDFDCIPKYKLTEEVKCRLIEASERVNSSVEEPEKPKFEISSEENTSKLEESISINIEESFPSKEDAIGAEESICSIPEKSEIIIQNEVSIEEEKSRKLEEPKTEEFEEITSAIVSKPISNEETEVGFGEGPECKSAEEATFKKPENLICEVTEEPTSRKPEELTLEDTISKIPVQPKPRTPAKRKSKIPTESKPKIPDVPKNEIVESQQISPQDSNVKVDYPEDLNPFDDQILEKSLNPFEDDEDDDQEVLEVRPQPKPRSKKISDDSKICSGKVAQDVEVKSTNPFEEDEEDDDDCNNPFGDDDEEEEVVQQGIPKAAPRDLNKTKNSGALDEGVEGELDRKGLRLIQPPKFRWSETLSDESDFLSSSSSFCENRPLKFIPAPKISMPFQFVDGILVKPPVSPFDSEDEDEEDEDNRPKNSADPPEPKPRSSATSVFSEGSFSSNASSAASSTAPSLRKKKAAPRPPIPFDKQGDSPRPSTSLQASPSPRSRKVRRAPLPPHPTSTPLHSNAACLDDSFNSSPIVDRGITIITRTLESKDCDKNLKDETNRNRQSESNMSYTLSAPNKSTYGKWKRKKGQAPLRPVPIMREVKPLPLVELRNELDTIEIQLQGLGKQTVRLEEIIRDKCEGPETDPDSPISEEAEDLIIQMFELINEKNELVRRQAELMYLQRQQRLEREHAEVEYEIRCLMLQPEENKTDFDKEREEELINRLVDIVERRNEVIECLEMDRRRAAEEDRSINSSLNSYTSKIDESLSPNSKENLKKKKKFKNKFKLKGSSSNKDKIVDADKDVDESEANVVSNKVKKKKFNLF